jgi:hypothetical protein
MHPHLAYIKNKTTKSPYVFIYKAPGKKSQLVHQLNQMKKKKNQSEPPQYGSHACTTILQNKTSTHAALL